MLNDVRKEHILTFEISTSLANVQMVRRLRIHNNSGATNMFAAVQLTIGSLILATFGGKICMGQFTGGKNPRIEVNSSSTNSHELSSDARLPYFDLVVAVHVIGGNSLEAQEEIAHVRRLYGRYRARKIALTEYETALTFRVVFIVGSAGLPEGTEIPEGGLLVGDFFHVNINEGYSHLGEKTKATMALSDHLRCTQHKTISAVGCFLTFF